MNWFYRRKWKKINFQAPKKEIFLWIILGIILYILGKYLDQYAFGFLKYFHTPELDKIMIFLTEKFIYLVLGIFVLSTAYRFWKSGYHYTKLIPALFAVITAGISAYVLKSFFGILRPFKELALEPLVHAGSYSFPSGHTAVGFALLIPLWRISKPLGLLWFIFALLVGFGRVYEYVHYPSDIAGGIFLGGVIGAIFSHPEIHKMLLLAWEKLEFRRQSFHFIFGFVCVFAHWSGFLRLREIGFLLLIGLFISIFSQYKTIPIISDLLKLFDRPRDKEFPGRGAFYFLCAVFFSLLIFPLEIAYAAILILAVGDSFNHLVGGYLGYVKNVNMPWNPRKNTSGMILGIAFGTFAAQFFVPILPAFIATSCAIIIETFPFKIGKFYIDDNLTVPLTAGIVLYILTYGLPFLVT